VDVRRRLAVFVEGLRLCSGLARLTPDANSRSFLPVGVSVAGRRRLVSWRTVLLVGGKKRAAAPRMRQFLPWFDFFVPKPPRPAGHVLTLQVAWDGSVRRRTTSAAADRSGCHSLGHSAGRRSAWEVAGRVGTPTRRGRTGGSAGRRPARLIATAHRGPHGGWHARCDPGHSLGGLFRDLQRSEQHAPDQAKSFSTLLDDIWRLPSHGLQTACAPASRLSRMPQADGSGERDKRTSDWVADLRRCPLARAEVPASKVGSIPTTRARA
jgi:hypothetical protein